MSNKRKIEVYSAGCSVCEETIEMVHSVACSSCEVSILDMKKPDVAKKAKSLGIKSVPAVIINDKLADCCSGRGVDEMTLRNAGLGKPIPLS